ncbi:TrbC/VirB2 family protein [Massilia sp. LjRoot122]|uniref:TrbC/VirB2 family protein n=1 Tax=Massilia sp. LjRoot122 TaxID=3342257 RepID=UPI003ED126A4
MKNIFSKLSGNGAKLAAAWDNLSPTAKGICKASAMGVVLMSPTLAFAQGGAGNGNQFFCYIANYFKGIVGSCALVVILLWAIEHFFGVAKLHDVVIKVGIGAAIVAGSSIIIVNSGLTPPNCMIG